MNNKNQNAPNQSEQIYQQVSKQQTTTKIITEVEQIQNDCHAKQRQQNRSQGDEEQEQIKEVDDEGIPVETILIDPEADLLKLEREDPEQAHRLKNEGTKLFKEQNYQQAILNYEQSIHYTQDKIFRGTIFSNIAICYIKNDQYNKALKYCQRALQQDEHNKKARMNLGRCYEKEQKYEEAFEEFKKIKINEGNPLSAGDVKFISDKIVFLEKKVNEINEKRKEEVLSGLKNIGNSVLGYFGMSLDNFKMEKGENGGYNIQFKQ